VRRVRRLPGLIFRPPSLSELPLCCRETGFRGDKSHPAKRARRLRSGLSG
jgi:hypothetical protein